MKILHIHPSMAGGGIESMICGLANTMSNMNHDITVCSIFTPKCTDVFWNKLSSNVTRATLGKSSKGFSLKALFRIYKFIKNGNYDVVHIHGFLYYYLFSILLLHRSFKFFYTVHSDAFKENSRWDKRLIYMKKLCFNCNWIRPITISPASKKSFEKLYHCDSKLIFNGTERFTGYPSDFPTKYRFSTTTKVFLHAGRVDIPKNQLVLCQVFHRLLKDGYDIVLLIAGAVQNQSVFTSIEPYFSDRIVFLGERADIQQLLAACDGFCLPSIWEGLPVTVLEALSVGCIPVCSPVGGIPDIIKSGFNGFLSKSCNEVDYYHAMKDFLDSPEQSLLDIKKNAMKSFSPFDIQVAAANYLVYYNL